MNTKIKRDENTEYLINEGATILEYTAGYSKKRDGYIAIALVEKNGEFFVWWNYKTTDYKELLEDERTRYEVSDGHWDSFDDNEEMARIEYNGMSAQHNPKWVSIAEVDEINGHAIYYRNRQYGRNINGDWEPNF